MTEPLGVSELWLSVDISLFSVSECQPVLGRGGEVGCSGQLSIWSCLEERTLRSSWTQLDTAKHCTGWKDTGEGQHRPPSVSRHRTRVILEICKLPDADERLWKSPRHFKVLPQTVSLKHASISLERKVKAFSLQGHRKGCSRWEAKP